MTIDRHTHTYTHTYRHSYIYMTGLHSIHLKNLSQQLINYLNYLPVHKLTKYRLEKIIIRNATNFHVDEINIFFTVAKLCKDYEESYQKKDKRGQYKALQSMIWNIYFQWDNHYVSIAKSSTSTASTASAITSNHMKGLYKYPPHLRPLLKTSGTTLHTYNGLLNNWPLEYHYDILHSNENPKKITTLRNMWLEGHPDAIEKSLLNVSNHKHNHNKPTFTFTFTPTSTSTGSGNDHDNNGNNAMRIEEKRHDYCKIIEPILSQCYFLNNILWKNENKKRLKPIAPIVEVPFNARGTIIAEKRVMNLIRDKLKTLRLILTKQWPALYDEKCIEEMLTLLQLSSSTEKCTNSILMHRDLLRIHERCFQNRMYRVIATPKTATKDGAHNTSKETEPFQQEEQDEQRQQGQQEQEIQFERIF